MSKTTIILADEDKNVLSQMTKHFDEENYTILAQTQDGEELIKLIKNLKPDVVVMDVVLQKCDGFKVLESVKDVPTNIVV